MIRELGRIVYIRLKFLLNYNFDCKVYLNFELNNLLFHLCPVCNHLI